MKILFIAALAVVCVCSELPGQEDAAPHGDWFVYQDGETRFGSQHVVTRPLPNGDIEYRVETRLLSNLLGTPQESVTKATYVVTPDFAPVSLTSRTVSRSGEIQITGKREDGRFHLQRDAHDVKRDASLNLDKRPVFEPLLPYSLIRLGETKPPAEGQEITISVIDEESLTAEPASCRVLKVTDENEVHWSVVSGRGDDTTAGRQVIVGAAGRLREELEMTGYTLVRASRQEAEQLEPLKLEGRNVLMFEVDQAIARPDRLQELTVKLRWKGIPLSQFQLIDARQSVTSHKQDDTDHEALITIRTVTADKPDTLELLPADQRQALLGSSRYIDPADPEIASTAKAWTRDANGPLEAVKALADREFALMNGGDLISETLSGPEVLQCRKGKCSEYSVLFASLARSVGLPTRIVLGERMVGGHWIGHMWNEVFIESPDPPAENGDRQGYWVTVDCTTGQIGSAPELLKLIHSPTVLGTQPLRWKLTESLQISVEKFIVDSEEQPEAWKTGLTGHRYTNSDFDLRVAAPDPEWTVVPDAKAGQVILRFKVPGEEHVFVHVVAVSLPIPLSAEAMLLIRKTRFSATYQEFKVISEKAVTINGRNWQTLQFSRAMGPKEAERHPGRDTMKTTEFAYQQGNVVYLINLIAEESAHDKHADPLRRIVESMEIKSDAEKEK